MNDNGYTVRVLEERHANDVQGKIVGFCLADNIEEAMEQASVLVEYEPIEDGGMWIEIKATEKCQ